MPIPTNAKQPLFLYATAAEDGQYLAIAADGSDSNVTLARGIYCLTSVGVALNYALDVAGSLDGTNGAHLPANDTRLIVVKDPAGANFTCQLAPDGTEAGAINIVAVQPVPEIF